MLLEVSLNHLSLVSLVCLHSCVFLTLFKTLLVMADYIICKFFVSVAACASSAYVKGLDDIEWEE